jgi:hypothetical protein
MEPVHAVQSGSYQPQARIRSAEDKFENGLECKCQWNTASDKLEEIGFGQA